MAKPKTMSIEEFSEMFPTEESAVDYFESLRWPDGKTCPHCGSVNVSDVTSKKPMPYRCRDCRKHFSVRTNTVMQSSKIGIRIWLLAIYFMSVAKKGVSSCQMARQLGIRQATAWFLQHRIRESWNQGRFVLDGEVEVDETYIGGKEKNKHKSKKQKCGRGMVGKTPVVGLKQRKGKVFAVVVGDTKTETLHEIIDSRVAKGVNLYTDDHAAYRGIDGMNHTVVRYSAGEYVKGCANTNSIESFWALLKRGYYGTFHKMSLQHLSRYVDEFADRSNSLDKNTLEHVDSTLKSFQGRILPYKELIKDDETGN